MEEGRWKMEEGRWKMEDVLIANVSAIKTVLTVAIIDRG